MQSVSWRDTSCCCDECINQLWPNCTARADNWKTVSLFPKTCTVPLKVACGCDIFCVCADRTLDESTVKVIVTKHREKQKIGQSNDNDNDSHPDRADVDAEDTEGVVVDPQEDEETESVAFAEDEPGVDEPEVSYAHFIKLLCDMNICLLVCDTNIRLLVCDTCIYLRFIFQSPEVQPRRSPSPPVDQTFMLGSTRYTVDEDETESVAESYAGGQIGMGTKLLSTGHALFTQ